MEGPPTTVGQIHAAELGQFRIAGDIPPFRVLLARHGNGLMEAFLGLIGLHEGQQEVARKPMQIGLEEALTGPLHPS